MRKCAQAYEIGVLYTLGDTHATSSPHTLPYKDMDKTPRDQTPAYLTL